MIDERSQTVLFVDNLRFSWKKNLEPLFWFFRGDNNNFEAVSVASKSPASSYRSNRNHSEPASIQQLQQEHSASFNDIHNASQQQQQQQHQQNPTTVTPLSTRSHSSMTISRDAPVPRLCRVRAYEDQLGFTVSGSKTTKGIFKVNDVTPNSPAAHSGLMNGDYIIEISGRPVESMDYSDVVTFIKEKKQEDDLQLLVADSHTLNWYKQKKIQISSRIVPKMQYIETLLKKDLMADAVINPDQSKLTLFEPRIFLSSFNYIVYI